MPGPAANEDPDSSYCAALLRRDDPDRWLASLFIPQDLRPPVQALYAFALEIARVREVVSEPLLGEIRHQWWREAIEAPEGADVQANPVAAALLAARARAGLPKAALLELIDARVFDLYDDAMESVEGLESYARATAANLFRLVALLLGDEGEAAGCAAEHAGIAYALTGLLRALPWHGARGQVFVPLEILHKHGADREDIAAGRSSPEVLAALADLRALARRHLDAFAAQLPRLPGSSRPAFLPASLCDPYLRLMERRDYRPFETMTTLPQWRRQWILWRAARRWS
jgi:phytoene synthase